jgi:hypothetical protein
MGLHKTVSAFIAAMLLCLTPVLAHAESPASPEFPGTILINLNDYNKYVEFQFTEGVIQKTGGGEARTYEEGGVTYVEERSDGFGKALHTQRLYRYDMEDRLAGILSQLDLQRAHDLLSDFVHRGGKLERSSYVLTGPGRKPKYMTGAYADNFYPNRQLTYAVYRTFAGASLLNLSMNEMSFPFGTDDVKTLMWNDDGTQVAYISIDRKDRAALVVRDIAGDRTILRMALEKYPYDVTWSPDSSYIAVLTSTRFLGVWPWELLAAAAGHPYFHITFYLQIYDTAGNKVVDQRVKGGLKNGSGSMVWMPR